MPDGDHSVNDRDRASAEFLLRCVVADPCRSSVKAKPLSRMLHTSPQQAGSILAALGRDPPPDIRMDKRPGGRGGARWVVSRG